MTYPTTDVAVGLHKTVRDVLDEFLVTLSSTSGNQATVTIGKVGRGNETFTLKVGETAVYAGGYSYGPIEVRLVGVDEEAHTATFLLADMRKK